MQIVGKIIYVGFIYTVRQVASVYSLGTDRTENTYAISSNVACVSVAAITLQRPLFTGPLLSNGYCKAAYFSVVA
jgi:hypothetical protein